MLYFLQNEIKKNNQILIVILRFLEDNVFTEKTKVPIIRIRQELCRVQDLISQEILLLWSFDTLKIIWHVS